MPRSTRIVEESGTIVLVAVATYMKAIVQDSGKAADAAHADAMSLRNKQYQKLHGDYQKLSAEHAAKRQLASRQAAQLLQLQVCESPCVSSHCTCLLVSQDTC